MGRTTHTVDRQLVNPPNQLLNLSYDQHNEIPRPPLYNNPTTHSASTMATTTPSQPNQNQDRLKTHFTGHTPSAHSKRWDELWSDGTFLPWDRGYANPALIDTLHSHTSILPSPLKPDGTRRRALVPGCGKGYDIALFAAHGYDSYGIEVSENAVRIAEEYLKEPGEGPLEGEYKVKEGDVGRGEMMCLLGDFFEDGDGWLEGAGGLREGFDIIYDNTVSVAV
jgi:SAM-dependent methyltransferase